ncbi:Ig-like domain repeat protein [Paludisphaera mucosa]|uniref:Ig-like domain repeat protein n=1 Tax=Paludisphaera mucosa TaxID=3030827 RepID=A0ABT6FJG3_9BACT|nr:Ig-like domain repeat protein [Paludisphaera mucosa]MDG3007728.1 Ig-like domain repeat protein [Paludisphaera mucosa]
MSSNLWSDPGNWTLGAPTMGQDLVFPANAPNKTSIYDSGLGVSNFGAITIEGSGYDIGASFAGSLSLTNGLSATFGSSISNFDIDFDPGDGTVSIGAGGTLELGGEIMGTSGLAVSGGGTIQLGGISANTYAGTTTVATATTLVLDKSSATAVTGSLAIIGGGTVRLAQSDQIADAAMVALGSGATLDLNNFDDAIGVLELTGATVATGIGTLTLGGDVTSNTDIFTSAISGNLDLGGATRAFTVANNAQLDPDLSITANISGTGAGLTKLGADSQLRLSGNNTYDGVTTIAAGLIEIASDNALGASSAGTVVDGGFSLALLGGITTPEPITLTGAGLGGLGAVFNGNGDNTISGAITLGAASTIGSLSGNLTFSGAINDGASSFALTKVQSGTVTLAGANTYDGGTTISGGVIAISNGSALGTGSVLISNGAELDLSNDITLSRNISFSGTGAGGGGALRSVSGNNVYSGTATPLANDSRIQVDAGQLNFSGDLTGGNGIGLGKFGAGVLLIAGSLTSAPIFHAVEGDLRITGSDSSVVTSYGGTISGTGTVGSLDHAGGSSGAVDPGTGGGTTGTFTTSGGYQVGTHGTTHIDIGGTTAGSTYDQIANTTSGSVDITGSTIDVSLVGGFVPAIGDEFIVIDKQNSGAVTGTFLNLAEGDTFRSGVVTYQVSYVGGNGNDVTLEVVGVTYTWTGLGGDGNWSTDANWDTNLAPSGGEDLVFPSGAARRNNNNDLSGKTFRSIEIAGGGYDIAGNAITLTDGLSATFVSDTSEFHPGIALTATETIDVVDGGDLILSGAISGAGFGIVKTGGGTLEYTGFSANTYTGATTVNAGTLILNRASGQNAIAGNLVVGDNVGGGEMVQIGSNNQIADVSDVTVNEGATFDVGTTTETIDSLTLQGASVTIGSGGILIPFSLATTVSTSHAPSTIQGPGTLDLRNNPFFVMIVARDSFNNGTINADAEISATIQNGGIIKSGSGTLALSGPNTYASATSVSGGGIQVKNNSALGTTASGTTVASGASVYFNGSTLSISESFSIAGTGFINSGALTVVSGSTTLAGDVGLSADSQIGATDGSTLTINGVIDEDSSSYGLNVVNGANGRTVLNGSNLFDGDVVASSGFVRGNNDNSFGDPASSSNLIVQSGATLELAGGITIPSTKTLAISGVPVSNSSKIMSVSGDNTIAGDIGITGGNNVAFDVAGGTTLTVSGVISGSRDFDKNNTGTLILTGTNTNTGSVSVGDGTLIVDGSLATSNSVFVDGTLGGSGTLPAVTISNIGRLSPGNSPGLLNTGSLAFQSSGSTYNVELNGTTAGTQYDQTDVTATVILAGATLSVSLGYAPAIGDTYTIINNDGTDAVDGTFNGLAEGSTITVGRQSFAISYVGSDGNDVTLTALLRTDVWTGAHSSSLSDPLNWVGGLAPLAGDRLIFPANASSFTIVNDFAAGTRFDSFVFASGYTVTGNAATLDAGISSTYAAGTVTFGLDVTLTATETLDVAGGGTLDMSGVITVSNFGGGFGVTKIGGGTLKYSGSSANLYNGVTTVTQGTLLLAKSDDVISANGSVYVGDVSGGATLRVMGDNQFWVGSTVTLVFGSTFDVGAYVEHISPLNLEGSTVQIDAGGVLATFNGVNTTVSPDHAMSTIQGLGELQIWNASNNFDIADDPDLAVELRISTAIQGLNPGSGFSKSGSGVLALSGDSTYGGDTTITGGAIQVESGGALGTTDGDTIVYGGASVFFSGPALSTAENFIVAGAGLGNAGALEVLSGSATLTGDVILAGDSQIGAADGATLTINGAIQQAGTRSLTLLQGATSGRTVLGGGNTYTGGTTVASGTLAITNASALGSGTATIGDGSNTSGHLEIDLAGTGIVSNTFVFNAPITTGLQVNSGAVTFNGGTTLGRDLGINVATGASLQFAGPINDGGQARSLTKAGPGTLEFSGVNTYTGTTFVDEGLLLLNCGIACIAGDVTVSGPGAAATVRELRPNQIADGSTVRLANAGATLDLNGFDDTIGSLSLTGSTVTTGVGTLTIASGGGITTLASSQTATIGGHLGFGGANNFFTVAQGTTQSGVDFSVSAVVSGWINIIKDGAGTMALSGANTYSGGTNINLGVLAISADTGAGTGVVNILGTGTLDLSGGITVANTLNVDSSGTAIRNSGGTNTISGALNLGVDATIDTAASSVLAISSTVDDSGNIWSLTKTGAGTLGLDGANTYLGGTTVAAGILAISNSGSLGTGNVVNNAEIEIVNNLLLNNNFTINSAGTAFLIDGLTTIQGTITLLSNLVIDTPGFANLYLNGVIGGGFGVAKNGSGTLGLGQANTYSGGTSINGGYLQVFDGQATGATGTLAIDTGAVFVLSTATYTLPSGGLRLADSTTFLVPLSNVHTLNGEVALAGDTTFSIAAGGVLTVDGPIGGAFGLTKTNGGALILGAASTYTGPTTIAAGELIVNGDLTSSPTIEVQSGAVLSGSGRLAQVQVDPAGVFSPGNSPDTITIDSLALSPGASFVEELFGNSPGDGATGYDQTIVTAGPVDLDDATLTLSLGGDYAPAAGDVLTIIDNRSNAPINGVFNGLAEGSLVNVGGTSFRLTYFGGDGNDVVLAAVVSTATALSISPIPSVFGQWVTLRATVTAGAANGVLPTGSVTFLDGSTVLGTSAVDPSGVAVLATTGLSAGYHGITAGYNPTGNFLSSASTAALLGVNQATTSLSFSDVPSSTVFGQSVTLTAIVGVNSPGTGTPTGSVWFLEGQTVLGVAALTSVSGQPTAVFTTSALSVGTHAITAQYAGNQSFAASSTGSVSRLVVKAGDSTTLTGGGTTGFGQPATFIAVVSATAPGAGTPTGWVTFLDGSTPIGTAGLNGGTATFTTSSLASGSHAITATYTSGDANFNAGTPSSSVTQVVDPAASAVVLTSSAPTSTYGQPVTLSAFVAAAYPNAGPATGLVTFRADGVLLGSAAVEGGSATLTLNNLDPGVRQITAAYSGDGSLEASQAAITQRVSPAPTTAAVSVQTVGNWWHRSSRIVVKVDARPPGAIPPSGTAQIFVNGRLYRSVRIVNGSSTTSIPNSYRFKAFGVVFQSNPHFAASWTRGVGPIARPWLA